MKNNLKSTILNGNPDNKVAIRKGTKQNEQNEEALEVQTLNKPKCFRIGKGRNLNGQLPIKVCFTSEKEKEEFLGARKKKMITSKDLGYEEGNVIYLNHDESIPIQRSAEIQERK
ncbi:hypothetical protein JTB14_024640 [Gonioctena quinquepunctata]|nr:hypothetical protein JTB14_024640 [Gonioctena quinquepunctata]